MRFCLFILAFFLMAPGAWAQSETIAAVVNQDAITKSDVEERLKLIAISSGLPYNEEIRARLAPQIVNSLIDEQIIFQEAKRLEINIDEKEVGEGITQIASQNNMTQDQLMSALKGSGININTMKKQIESQLAWSKVIQAKLRPQVTITDNDIDDFINRMRENAGKAEYLAAEIFLPVEDPKQQEDTRRLAERLVSEVRSGKAPFFKLAQQFSKAAGAAQGGDMGWVQQGQLSEELDVALGAMEKNSVSNPVRSPAGYHIFLVRDRRVISEESIPPREQVMSMLGVQRLERMQRRYLLDLKSTAFIENRVNQG